MLCEDYNRESDCEEGTGDSLPTQIAGRDIMSFPRRCKAATMVSRTLDWGELLAKATEEDKKSEITPEIFSDDDTDTENTPMNLTAPHTANNTESALDLSALNKSAGSHGKLRGYTMPTCEQKYKTPVNFQRNTPLRDISTNTDKSRNSYSKDIDVVCQKTLVQPSKFSYESEVVRQKVMCLSSSERIGTGVIDPNVKTSGKANDTYAMQHHGKLPRVEDAPAYDGLYRPYNLKHKTNPRMFTSIPKLDPSVSQQPPERNLFAVPEVPARYRSSTNEIVVNQKSYQVLALLGKGGSSKVYLVLAKNNSLLAIKCVNLASVDEKLKMDHLNEIEHLRHMQHCPHIIRIIDHQFIPSRQLLYAVMERGDTDLSRLLKERASSGCGVSPEMILFYWSEILLAVKSIHDNNIIHQDLKPANFLLVQGRLKLIDFGIASSIQSEQTSVFKDSQSGTPNYMSPEAWEDLGMGDKRVVKIGKKADVWSLGCILYSFLYGKTPYQEFTHHIAKFRAITNPQHVIEFPPLPGIPEMLIESCRRCLVHDKNKRASIEELLALKNQMLMTSSDAIHRLRNVLDPASLRVAELALTGNESKEETDQLNE